MDNNVSQNVAPKQEDDEIDILEILMFLRTKWKFLLIFLVAGLAVGGLASMWMRPAYKSDILLQVDVKGNKSAKALGEMGALLDVSTPSEAEMQLIKSRMVLSSVVDGERMRYSAVPLNKVDRLLHKEGRMDLEFLSIPRSVSEAKVKLFATVLQDSVSFEISDSEENSLLTGTVGETYRLPYGGDTLVVCVRSVKARPGQKFILGASDQQSAVAGIFG